MLLGLDVWAVGNDDVAIGLEPQRLRVACRRLLLHWASVWRASSVSGLHYDDERPDRISTSHPENFSCCPTSDFRPHHSWPVLPAMPLLNLTCLARESVMISRPVFRKFRSRFNAGIQGSRGVSEDL